MIAVLVGHADGEGGIAIAWCRRCGPGCRRPRALKQSSLVPSPQSRMQSIIVSWPGSITSPRATVVDARRRPPYRAPVMTTVGGTLVIVIKNDGLEGERTFAHRHVPGDDLGLIRAVGAGVDPVPGQVHIVDVGVFACARRREEGEERRECPDRRAASAAGRRWSPPIPPAP